MRKMYSGWGGIALACTISGHRRTRVFEFPGALLTESSDEPHHTIYESASMGATVTSNLVDCFADAAFGDHYAISPSLRHVVDETWPRAARAHGTRLFVVVEEVDAVAPVAMNQGECCVSDEVLTKGGEELPRLLGGRQGEQFIAAWPTIDGAWPELPADQRQLNLVMAGVRAAQQHAGPIQKLLDQRCLVTDDGRFVDIMQPTMHAPALTADTPLDATGYAERAARIRDAVEEMERDLDDDRVALVFRSMYCEDAKDESFQQLFYLHLRQSGVDAAGALYERAQIAAADAPLAGSKTPSELKDYRNDIAHGRTEGIDVNFLADLQRTVNQLIRAKYFRPEPSSNPTA
ncbi:hypothetical protein [Candidatus Poriferisodalis sp.]|uniref:hypothetical protein n=1 Tax=Candidatus Poriferisodalis sp. TaxID=3101277 RepID=UPI003D0DB4F3